MQTLDKYLKARGITGVQFADQIGLTHVSVSRIRNGHQWPTHQTAWKIWEATNGKVGFVPSKPAGSD